MDTIDYRVIRDEIARKATAPRDAANDNGPALSAPETILLVELRNIIRRAWISGDITVNTGGTASALMRAIERVDALTDGITLTTGGDDAA